MKINLSITQEGIKTDHGLEIPTGWSQVPFRLYKPILKANDLPKKLAVFTGLDEDLIRKAEIHNLPKITASLHFLTTEPVYTVPKTCLGFSIAKNLDTKSAAQYADLMDIWQKFKENDINNFDYFPLIVATYAVKPYDYQDADNLAPTFLEAPCTEVLAIGNFTLVRLHALRNGIVPKCPPGDTPLNRVRQAMISYLERLDSSIRYAFWKRSLPINERRYLNGRY